MSRKSKRAFPGAVPIESWCDSCDSTNPRWIKILSDSIELDLCDACVEKFYPEVKKEFYEELLRRIEERYARQQS